MHVYAKTKITAKDLSLKSNNILNINDILDLDDLKLL